MSKLWVIGGMSGIGQGIFDYEVESGRYDIIATEQKEIDVTNWNELDFFVQDQGPFDAVVYSAGVTRLCNIPNLDATTVSNIFEVNVEGFIGLIRALSYHQESGQVVAIVSDASRVPMRGSIAYCSSKAALVMAIRCAARELAPNWRINGVSPGIVDGTPMTEYIDKTVPDFRGWTPEEARAYELSMVPMGRRATVPEVAALVSSVLHGPEFLTGSIVEMTGGK